mmetsp:Transcript_60173/g.127460  ORF Transcript_60173/g.127460 Transcript_60173/m.127460 type:complete len:244 (+) Transcript_60173:141-872(+)|eukprot:CAMPEP_0206478910 /NCGR_PEP_ID=MMETSP0324_2-20121206/36369_1 /ASSEMBLY_ACC=CAM_ASM_000836 /TAXON_ID=2866 /ORGANISM="Crypthecodinium cohnii, Strain Seligo" /LENGTH=243 /DNA_ID=CAMNT_0053955375 /DNA_START=56 /DNA_END=787 /DNA_ORIENTATION=+
MALGSKTGPMAERLGLVGRALAVGFSEAVQRVLILGADILLILFASVAMGQDWNHSCDENLHAYGFLCIVLSSLDMLWEMVRCSSESSLDRMQQDFSMYNPSANEEGLLENTPTVGLHGGVGEASGSRSASTSGGAIGQGVRSEKLRRQKRVTDLHFWSLFFSVSVAIVFSFFSAHDEECRELVPSLYSYIHTFTYVYIFRLGAILLWVCCRKVKDYEDAAAFGGGIPAPREPTEMQEVSGAI